MSRIPADVERALAAAWGARLGRDPRIAGGTPVGGGCISPAVRLEAGSGEVAFLKWGASDTPAGLFAAEARGLAALRAPGAVRVPEVLGVGDEGAGWLLLEWLEPALPATGTWEALGRGLAALHGTRAERYGAAADNFIGSLPQVNGWLDDWAAFWRERRLEPQLRRAYAAGYFAPGERRRLDRLLAALPERLAEAGGDGASLLHGDLWSGNVHLTSGGVAALIDPSCYHGHREVDLAMSELFGGFDAEFYRAYAEAWPLLPGYDPVRRGIYQLYYLLVHVNLFGGGYVRGALAAVGQAGF